MQPVRSGYAMSTTYVEHDIEHRYKRLDELPQKTQDVVREVCAARSVSVARVLSDDTRRPASNARHEIVWRLRSEAWGVTGKPPSLMQIGAWLGRDHTSVLHAFRRHAGTMADR